MITKKFAIANKLKNDLEVISKVEVNIDDYLSKSYYKGASQAIFIGELNSLDPKLVHELLNKYHDGGWYVEAVMTHEGTYSGYVIFR